MWGMKIIFLFHMYITHLILLEAYIYDSSTMSLILRLRSSLNEIH